MSSPRARARAGSSLSQSWVGESKEDDSSPQQLSFTADAQFKRDIQMVQGAIDEPGDDDGFSGKVLKRLFTLFYYGDLRYFKDGEWRPWDLPLASAICHGARVTIEFPADNDALMKYLLPANRNESDADRDTRLKKYTRSAATHNLQTVDKEFTNGENAHFIKEIKPVTLAVASQAGQTVAANAMEYLPFLGPALSPFVRTKKTHFGINIALGGNGNTNPHSGNRVSNNGEHGHLYMLYRPSITDKKTSKKSQKGGFLVGIEQSAPQHNDQNGGSHGILATHHALSATAGKDFAKPNDLGGLGPSRYYDGIHLKITPEQLAEIIKKYEHQLPDIKTMLSTTGHTEVRKLLPYTDAESQAKIVTLNYKEQTLIRYQEKEAGKNKGPFDGFYQLQEESKDEEEPHHYFIKAPSPSELFAELYSCHILEGLKEFIAEEYRDSLICTNELIQLPDGTYGLIQPKKEGITPLWKYFQGEAQKQDQGYVDYGWETFTTLISNANDRNGLYEMFYGQTQYYPLLANFGDINSLAVCLLYSLIIGDFSVHSDNIVYFKKNDTILFGKIDAGAGLRGIGADTDVMDPAEYHNFFSRYKQCTKAFHRFYDLVPGLYELVSQQAKELLKLDIQQLSAIALKALDKTPVDVLLTEKEKNETADYMGIEEFRVVSSDNHQANKAFSDKLARIMLRRITQLANMKVNVNAAPYKLSANELVDFAFSRLQHAWQTESQKFLQDNNDEAEEKQPLQIIQLIEPTDENSSYAMRFPLDRGRENIVLMSPACDAENSLNALGTTPLPQVLAKIRALQKNEGSDTYFVPLAECQAFAGLVNRHHWTLLMIQGKKCYFMDPCGQLGLSSLYFLDHIKAMLAAQKFEVNPYHYLNWQAIWDNTNCGRFVSAMIAEAVKLIYSATPFDKITDELGKLDYPSVDRLIFEQSQCQIPLEIKSNRAVCCERRQDEVFNDFQKAKQALEEAAAQAQRLAAEAEAQRLAQAEAAANKAKKQKIIIGAGILFAGVGALVKFSTLIAISLLTSTIGIALMMGGSMITLYGFCFFNKQNREVLDQSNMQGRQLHHAA